MCIDNVHPFHTSFSTFQEKNRLGSVIYDLGIPISRFSLHMSPCVATVTTLLCRLTSPSILSNCTGCVCNVRASDVRVDVECVCECEET